MITTEFGSTSLARRRRFRRGWSVIASHRLGRRFSPPRASEGHDSCLLKKSQPLQVGSSPHRRHRKARSRLADRTDQPAAPLHNACERSFHRRLSPGDADAAPRPAIGQQLTALPHPVDVITKAVQPQKAPPLIGGRAAAIGIEVPAPVARIEHLPGVPTVSPL